MGCFSYPRMANVSDCQDYDQDNLLRIFKALSEQFAAFHLNARSIRNKTDDISLFLNCFESKFHVLYFTESWLTPKDSPPQFASYVHNGIVCSSNRGGGISMYVKDTLNHDVIDDLTCMMPHIECLTMCVQNVIVAAVYRPPTGYKPEFFTFIEKLLAQTLCDA